MNEENNMHSFKLRSHLIRWIKDIFDDEKEGQHTAHINEGITGPLYEITIKKLEKDYFIDEKGQKWKKVNE
jgi:hypothetical protein